MPRPRPHPTSTAAWEFADRPGPPRSAPIPPPPTPRCPRATARRTCAAYRLPSTGGEGQTIALVDAYDDPTAEADMAV
ncbi:hypothetical protein [Streptomyces camelliae]|uniref:Uncharacterized protein n=1 Tax=Streptomyces camelliae TaxID=3004093 RepID=A0ABY7NTK4_9ACTN|nr:hypothetical protein [Streptomyces sp. HUAS 2-6]WBO61520.1 hypothetical protein O1G22_00840 [Streptomyces sp. HUAS 2-6]